jgi:hypothetical protein
MSDSGDTVEPRLEALQRVLEAMTQCIGELDRLGIPIAAARLEHACEVVRDELGEPAG